MLKKRLDFFLWFIIHKNIFDNLQYKKIKTFKWLLIGFSAYIRSTKFFFYSDCRDMVSTCKKNCVISFIKLDLNFYCLHCYKLGPKMFGCWIFGWKPGNHHKFQLTFVGMEQKVPFAMETICAKQIEWKWQFVIFNIKKIQLEMKSTLIIPIIFCVVLNWYVT